MSLEEIERLALQLPVEERGTLIEHLIASLDAADEAEIERLWMEEAERRIKTFEGGRMASYPAEEVLREARERLR